MRPATLDGRRFTGFVAASFAILFLSPAPSFASLYSITNLNAAGGMGQNEGAAFDINEDGQVVGYMGIYRAFMYSDGLVSMFVPPAGAWPFTSGYGDSWASAINDSGQVVGLMTSNFYGNYELRNFLYDGSSFSDLGTIDSTGFGQYPRIDESGTITPGGVDYLDGSVLLGLLEENQGWESLTIHATNSSGWIVGRGYLWVPDDSGTLHYMSQAFVARPVPEPGTLALFGAGMLLFRAMSRRGKAK